MSKVIVMTTGEVVSTYEMLENFVSKDTTLPLQFAWDIEDNIESFKKIVLKFEKHKNDLLKPLNEKNAFQFIGDGKVKVSDECIPEFNSVTEKINELLNIENEVTIKTVSKENLPNSISNKDLRALRFMVDVD